MHIFAYYSRLRQMTYFNPLNQTSTFAQSFPFVVRVVKFLRTIQHTGQMTTTPELKIRP